MTDADTPRVPDVRWHPQLGLFAHPEVEDFRWVMPDEEFPADAVKLGDVEALREDLADAERFMQRDRAQAMRATAERDRLRADIRAVLDQMDGQATTHESRRLAPHGSRAPLDRAYGRGISYAIGRIRAILDLARVAHGQAVEHQPEESQ